MTQRSWRWRYLAGGLVAGSLVAGLAQAQPIEAPAFELHGVVLVENGTQLALLREPRLVGGTAIFRPGDKIGPFTVVEVGEDHVRLERDGEGLIVPLRGSSRTTPVLPGGTSQVSEVGSDKQGDHPRSLESPGPWMKEQSAQKDVTPEERSARQEARRQRLERTTREALEAQTGPGNFLNLLQQSSTFGGQSGQ